MSTTADRSTVAVGDARPRALARAEGLELLGEVAGSGYERGISLARRADGQMVQLGPLMYALLEEVDGERDVPELSAAMCEKLGRPCDEESVTAIAEKLAAQGLLAGFEANAPKRANPLLALRWKVVVTDPALTRRLTAPFTGLFRPWVIAPIVVAFVAVCWFVLVEQGVASAAAHAFERPELILLLFGLGIAAAGFHELGHASACRYSGGTPGAMGMGIYLVWPAFYTDVTDAYRLPRRDRLRTDLGGLYFNSIVAVATLGAWFVLRMDALLLLIALQLVEMVKQLSPIIRADGYHILSDATGVPDLYAHIMPTLRRLLPGRPTEPSALTGRARLLVTAWVLLIVPLLLAIMLGMVLLLPKLAASAWASGSHVVSAMAVQATSGNVIDLLVSVLRLIGLALPVLGAGYIAWRLVSAAIRKGASWSAGRPRRRALAALAAAGVAALLGWAWWPSGQYEPIRASDGGTIRHVGSLVAARSQEPAAPAATPRQEPASPRRQPAAEAIPVPAGTYIGVSLIPEGGATKTDPAIFVITDPKRDGTPIVITSDTAPPADDPTDASGGASATSMATAFSFVLPEAPGEDDSQALAVNRTDGGVTYSIAYSLVTVTDGDPVDQRNSAHAYANCVACTTVAVSFQVVLVVGSSPLIAPVNIAEALNGNCPQCITTAIAHQIVVSIEEEPSGELLEQLNAELERLDALDELGLSPAELSAQVTQVQEGIHRVLADSGTLVEPPSQEDETSTTPTTDTGSTGEEPVEPATSDTATTDPATDTTTTSDPVASDSSGSAGTTDTTATTEPATTTP